MRSSGAILVFLAITLCAAQVQFQAEEINANKQPTKHVSKKPLKI